MSYWLAVVTEENCRELAERRYPFYALSHRIVTEAGDRCILYRSGKEGGFVGEFEFVGEPEEATVRVGRRTFPFRMPWKSIVLRDADPIKIGPLVQLLKFVKNKRLYGMALRTAFRKLEDADYERISVLLRHGVSEVDATRRPVIATDQSFS